ncbi:MAG: hypothetical protein K0R34_2890 [Herbinix sp.]|jgi:hypothetical protein|nr:hypothetical protein [Herbinix sp.]
MKRKFLEDMGLTKEQIDSIMEANGTDIETYKKDAEKYKTDLEEAQKTLKGFEGVDVKEMQTKLSQLNEDLKAKDEAHQKELSDRDFNSLLDGTITTVGAKNAKAVKALLDVDALKSSKNQSEDIKKALEAVKTENDYLFGSAEPIKNPVKPTGGALPAGDANTNALRAAMGLKPTTE